MTAVDGLQNIYEFAFGPNFFHAKSQAPSFRNSCLTSTENLNLNTKGGDRSQINETGLGITRPVSN